MGLEHKAVIFSILCLIILILISSCTNNASEGKESELNIKEELTAVTSKSVGTEDEVILTSELDTSTTSLNVTDPVYAKWETIPQLKQAISNVFDRENFVSDDIEQTAAELMDRNMICAYLYHTQVLFHYEPSSNEDGYYPAKFLLFQNIEEYESFVKGTYTKEAADSLLYGFEGKAPIFIEKDGKLFYNPNNMGFTVGPYFLQGID